MVKNTKAFITGWPVEHSRSPLVHGHWLETYGLNGDYVKHPCFEDDFQNFITSLSSQGYIGGNVTIPHKERAFEAVDFLHPAAKQLGAVNTVWMEQGVLHGDNTDGYGFLANLDDRSPGWDSDENKNRGALVLGAGGASRAIIYGLVERGFSKIIIANRTVERAKKLAEKFGTSKTKCEAVDINNLPNHSYQSALVVNTTSLGMDGKSLVVDLHPFAKNTIVHDIIYVPLLTPLLKQAKQLDMKTVDGLGMLLHQAVPGFERWFGVRPDVTNKLRAILLRDLGEAQPPLFYALTGSIGMGKSTTAQMFRDAGIPVHDADATVHRLYSGEAARLIEEEFSGTVIDGVVDRQKLGRQVVGNERAMKKLEAIIHPLVRREELAFREQVTRSGSALAILDIPLLFETGSENRVDGIIVVTAPKDVQRQRVLEREGMDIEKFEAILKRQLPDAEKRKRASFIIDTSKGLDAARKEVQKIIQQLKKDNHA